MSDPKEKLGTCDIAGTFDISYHNWPHLKSTFCVNWREVGEPVQGEPRRLDGKFSFDKEGVFNTVSGERVPDDEPLFMLRARDHYSHIALIAYVNECEEAGCNELHLNGIRQTISKFEQYALNHPERMKQPGITKHLKLDEPAAAIGEGISAEQSARDFYAKGHGSVWKVYQWWNHPEVFEFAEAFAAQQNGELRKERDAQDKEIARLQDVNELLVQDGLRAERAESALAEARSKALDEAIAVVKQVNNMGHMVGVCAGCRLGEVEEKLAALKDQASGVDTKEKK